MAYICPVSEVAGPSLAALSESPGLSQGSRRIRTDLASGLASQATQAMSYPHARGVVYGGKVS